MAVIDLTLNRLMLPGLANYTPPFGTKKSEDVALRTEEGCNNFTLPFEVDRPVVVSENSSCNGNVEHDSLVEIDTASVTFTLGNGAYKGVTVGVFCSAVSGTASVLCGAVTYTINAGGSIRFVWNGAAWEIEGDIVKTNVEVLTTDWVDESSGGATPTYTDYPWKAEIVITGVTTAHSPDVRFFLEDATAGVFAPVADTAAGKVLIYANEQPSAAVTIPAIICKKVG